MSACRDWERLVEHRDGSGDEPTEWRAAEAHLKECVRCRRSAVSADPTLLFAGMGSVEVSEADIVEVQQGVARWRHFEALQRRRPRPVPWLGAAAVVALTFGLVYQAWVQAPPATFPAETSVATFAASQLPPAAAGNGELWSPAADPWRARDWRLELLLQPPLENVEPRQARVYQRVDAEVVFVNVIDEGLKGVEF